MDNIQTQGFNWNATVTPGVSLAGIALGMDYNYFSELLSRYVVDSENSLYQFEMSPVLQLVNDYSDGKGVLLFSVFDLDLTNWQLYFNRPDHLGVNPRALAVFVRNDKVCVVKVWNFEKVKHGETPSYIYKGKLPCDIGLNDLISQLRDCMHLNYDDSEELFYADGENAGLELSGYGEFEDHPDQKIMAMAVVATKDDLAA